MMGLRIAVVGATGAVGREMWALLESSSLSIDRIHAFTSAGSQGTRLSFRDLTVECETLSRDHIPEVDLVLASAGSVISREWLPRFARAGARVIDNSSAFRSDPACPLVVPEINGDTLRGGATVIANPNCSTIQLVMALDPLHREWGLQWVRVATYQSASGAGNPLQTALREQSRTFLEDNETGDPSADLAFNVLPHIGDFDGGGESLEERKMRNETRRILGIPDLPFSATCVRVPVFRGHSEAVWVSFDRMPDPQRARDLLAVCPGVVVVDDPQQGEYPVPRTASGSPEVYVGRIRKDPASPQGLSLWVVSDNLLKGAATNAFQIAGFLVNEGLLALKRPAGS